jgi:hypothetical protein
VIYRYFIKPIVIESRIVRPKATRNEPSHRDFSAEVGYIGYGQLKKG